MIREYALVRTLEDILAKNKIKSYELILFSYTTFIRHNFEYILNYSLVYFHKQFQFHHDFIHFQLDFVQLHQSIRVYYNSKNRHDLHYLEKLFLR